LRWKSHIPVNTREKKKQRAWDTRERLDHMSVKEYLRIENQSEKNFDSSRAFIEVGSGNFCGSESIQILHGRET